MEDKKYTEGGFPVLPKTLRSVLTEGVELKPLNGRVPFSKLGKTIVGRVASFDVDTKELAPSDYLVTFDQEPNSDSRFFVKKVNAYSLRIEVKDPE